MLFQAYVDESYSDTNGPFVIAGYVSTIEAWAVFSQEWEQFLPLTKRGNSGKHRFKMSEMLNDMESVKLFYDIIEKHVMLSISCTIWQDDLRAAQERIWSDNVQLVWGASANVQLLSIGCLLGVFHETRSENAVLRRLFPLDDKVNFCFDKHSVGGFAEESWGAFHENQPTEVRDLYGEVPEFKDDEIYLPLQAADFWAWWVRKGYEDGTLQKYVSGDFGYWKGAKPIPSLSITFSEDQLVDALMKKIRRDMGGEFFANLYDAKMRPKTSREIPSITKTRSEIISGLSRLLRRIRRGR